MFSFPDNEREILSLWKQHDCFNRSQELSAGKEPFTFFDGPPFATGLPHYGHILASTIKDAVGRFFYQQGYRVDRRFGWDCHGLPVEYEIDKREGIKYREEVLEMGIKKYNSMCRSIVDLYTSEWKEVIQRLGRWVSFDKGYRTMDTTFMESVWGIFGELFGQNLIYRGYRVMPFSTACSTPVSNFEANQNYTEVVDPSIVLGVDLVEEIRGKKVRLLVWTTTPWTLPSNCALVVNAEFEYACIESDGMNFVVLNGRVNEYFDEKGKKKKGKILFTIKGKELVGMDYAPLFDYFLDLKSRGCFKVLSGDFVQSDTGTGIVHCAPGFGEDDYNCFVQNKIIEENEEVPCPIDDNGRFTDLIKDYAGRYVKDCDKDIIKNIKERGFLFNSSTIKHRYPMCWRSDTPLLYRLVPNWFILVKNSIDEMLENNEKINWVPANIKYRKFHDWLANAKDWSVSRNRFWGTPIPIWADKELKNFICVKSIKDLEEKSGRRIFGNMAPNGCKCKEGHTEECYRSTDIHRENIDDIVINKDGVEYRRIDEVLDCWFESGCMPYAQIHYPFSGKELILPADFIGEGIDQTRGWFYTLHVISSILFKRPAFKNVIVNGIVLAKDGKKMSKRLKNYPDVVDIINEFGSDTLRLTLLSSPVTVAENLRFDEERMKDVMKRIMIPWSNVLRFYLDSLEGEGALNMDPWLQSRFNRVLLFVSNEVRSYKLNNLMIVISEFVEDMSNWYIRINRDEIRNGKSALLGNILVDFAKMMAPFTPFFSEHSFQEIKRKMRHSKNIETRLQESLNVEEFESVHYLMYPDSGSSIVHEFDKIKKIIEGIRSIRETLAISLKTPLRSATIICEQCQQPLILSYENVIKKECNLLTLKFDKFENYLFNETVKPNFKTITGDEKKHKIEAIRQLSPDELRALIKSGRVAKNTHTVLFDEIIYSKEITGYEKVSKSLDDVSFILNTTMDDELIEMKTAREFFSFIQQMRKNIGLKIEDRRTVYVNNKELERTVGKYYDIAFVDAESGTCESVGEFGYKELMISVKIFK